MYICQNSKCFIGNESKMPDTGTLIMQKVRCVICIFHALFILMIAITFFAAVATQTFAIDKMKINPITMLKRCVGVLYRSGNATQALWLQCYFNYFKWQMQLSELENPQTVDWHREGRNVKMEINHGRVSTRFRLQSASFIIWALRENLIFQNKNRSRWAYASCSSIRKM